MAKDLHNDFWRKEHIKFWEHIVVYVIICDVIGMARTTIILLRIHIYIMNCISSSAMANALLMTYLMAQKKSQQNRV